MKKIIKLVVVALTLGLLALPVFADDAPAKEKNTSAIGVYVMEWNSNIPSGTEIAGLQFQHWFNNVGFQIELGGFAEERTYSDYDKVTGNTTKTEYLEATLSAGAQLMYSIFSTNQAKPFYARFYIWGMGGVLGYSDYNVPFTLDACAGVGLGSELVFWHRMSIPIEFGFAGNFPNKPNVSFSGAVGLRFRF